ncbi:MAG: histidine phosphatase family protein [Pseudomonadota bacterium]
MLKLTVMRHAKSSWDDPLLDDHDRPLNRRGVASAEAMGHWLRKRGHVPDTVLSSTSKRTLQTFECLALDCPVSFTRHLFHASKSEILNQLRKTADTNILFLGHNPGIAEFSAQIARIPPRHPDFDRFPTCATMVAEFDQSNWAATNWKTGHVTDFAIARDILKSKA